MADRIHSLLPNYVQGDLSIFPLAYDSKDTLYEVKNNAETTLARGINYSSKYLVVESTDAFPSKGLIKVGQETIYYGKKTDTSFQEIVRGFAGTFQSSWSAGTVVSCAVFAETHNAIKDAVINAEINLGLEDNPSSQSLNGLLKDLETRFLAPKPIFRGSATKGPAPLTVRFQNFSSGDPIRFLWDFGDGSTSVDISPAHTYVTEGNYTVKLNMITTLGAQGIVVKENYIQVDNKFADSYYYVTPQIGSTSTTFEFVDQSLGDVSSRYWIFDDGTNVAKLDPDIHTVTHTYSEVGTYNTALIIVFADGSLKRLTVDPIIVS